MFCRNCGGELGEGAAFCSNCGAKVALADAESTVKAEPEKKDTIEKANEVVTKAGETAHKVGDSAQKAATQVTDMAKDVAGKVSENVDKVFSGPAVPEEQKYLRAHPHNPAVLMSYDKADFKKPAEYKNIVVFVLLIFVTFGIYWIYQWYRMTKITNEDEKMVRRGPGAQCALCIFIPFYHLYWSYQTGKRIENLLMSKTEKQESIAVPALLFAIFGLGFVGVALMQNGINKYVGGITGQNMDANGIGTCKECGCHFPNDVRECPNCGAAYTKPFYESALFKVLLVLVVAGIVIAIVSSIIGAIAGAASHSAARSYDYYYYSLIQPTLALLK